MVNLKISQLIVIAGLSVLAGTLWLATTLQSQSADDIGKAVDMASRSFDRAQFHKDRDELDRFLAPDMRFIRGSGVVAGKNEFLAAFTDADTIFTAFDIRKRKVVALGRDAAIVSAEATIRGTSGGASFEEQILFSDLFVRRGGDVRVVHVQVTPLGKP